MAISSIANVDEVVLFREMANQFNNNLTAKCAYVPEIHKILVQKRKCRYHSFDLLAQNFSFLGNSSRNHNLL